MNATTRPLRRLALVALPWTARHGVPAWCWLLHLVLSATCLFGLWHLQRMVGMDRWLHSPWPALHRWWLPLLFVLAYLFAVLASGLWHALRGVATGRAAPDLDATWEEARQFLERSCFNARQLPLYLVLGALTGDLKRWLESIGASSLLPRSATPLHVYANPDAIFVICNSASLMGVLGTRTSAELAAPEETLDRLRHVCRMLERDRRPSCVIHGVLVAAPFQALQSDVVLQKTIAWCQLDLRTVRQATGLDCPTYMIVTGITGVPDNIAGGWSERFPLGVELEPGEAAAMLARRLDRLFARTLPRLTRARMQIDVAPAGAPMTDILRGNMQQFLFLTSAAGWRRRLQRLLAEGCSIDAGEPGLIAGCYFLPADLSTKAEASVHRTLHADLLTHQSFVSRTPETRAQVRREQRLTQQGYGLILASWLGLLLLAGWYAISR